MHALVIEQDMWIALMIEDALRGLGFASIACVSTCEEAVAAARRRRPDLITSAVRLGAGSALDAVREIRAEEPVPVVIVTTTPWEARGKISGAVVLPKPFGQRDLQEAVLRARAV
jgi:DNA-binding response OmpR family regulator